MISETNIQRKEEKKLEFFALVLKDLASSSFQQYYMSTRVFFFPQITVVNTTVFADMRKVKSNLD